MVIQLYICYKLQYHMKVQRYLTSVWEHGVSIGYGTFALRQDQIKYPIAVNIYIIQYDWFQYDWLNHILFKGIFCIIRV